MSLSSRPAYPWILLAAGTLAVFCALGLARFGYTVILPPMQAGLGLDNTQTGALATANLTGYLAFSAIGGALAPFIVVGIYHYFDSWRPAFLITASLGLVWLVLWKWLYRLPEDHPYISFTIEPFRFRRITGPAACASYCRRALSGARLSKPIACCKQGNP